MAAGNPSRPSWRWYLGITAGTASVLAGIYCLIHPALPWTSAAFLLLLGSGILALLFRVVNQTTPLSLQALEQSGIGQIVARAENLAPGTHCQQCGRTITGTPLLQGDAYFCSENCKLAAHTRMEKPRYFLQPPLSAEEMHALLDQAIQFGERAMHAASQDSIDRPLMIATQKGRGALPKVKQVILSLKIYQQQKWADLLQVHPPPEPKVSGGHRGTPRFFQVARNLQHALLDMDLSQNPFELFHLTEAVELKDIASLPNHDPELQAARDHLEKLLREGDRELKRLLSPGY